MRRPTSVSEPVGRKELTSIAIPEAESSREARVLRPGTDIDALRRIESMPLDEDDAQPRQRLAAPAFRRTGRVRTIEHLERNAQLFLQADKSSIDLFRGHG